MKRGRLNIAVDVAAFVAFVMLAATGLLIHYVLPPGSGRLLGPEGAGRPIITVWGLTRQEWGTLHLWIAITLLAVLALHLLLHGQWIVAMVRGQRREAQSGRGWRVAFAVAALLLLALIAAAPFITGTSRTVRGELLHERGVTEAPANVGHRAGRDAHR